MHSQTALVPVDLTQLPSSVSDEAVARLAKEGFLRRLELVQGVSKSASKVLPGHFAISGGGGVIDIGTSVDLVAISRRAKAIDFSDKNKPIVAYDMESDEFKRIDACFGRKGYQSGISFLIVERTTQIVCEWFMGTKTTTPLINDVCKYMQSSVAGAERNARPFTLTSEMRQGKEGNFYVPIVSPCTLPFTQMPSIGVLIEEARRFSNPPATEGTVVDDDADVRNG